MHRIALAAAAISLALAPAAFAQNQDQGQAPSTAPAMTAQPSTAAPEPMKPMSKAPHAIHYRSRSAAPLAAGDRSMADSRERRETRAMNLIGAAGYNDFSDLKPDGKHFSATAMKGGQKVSVLVDTQTGKVTPQ